MPIINEQKHPWCWKERLFNVYADGSIVESFYIGCKGGQRYYHSFEYKGKPVLRVIAKNKNI